MDKLQTYFADGYNFIWRRAVYGLLHFIVSSEEVFKIATQAAWS